MKSVIAYLQKISLRQMITTFLVGILFWTSTAFGYSNQFQSIAATVTPEASAYQVDKTQNRVNIDTDQAENTGKGLIDNLKSAAENVKDKLNLDEPIPESTKEFLDMTKDKANEAVQAPQKSVKGMADSVNNR